MKELLDERLLDHPTCLTKKMFGCHAYYLHGRLMLISAESGKEPWNGLLVAMERENHTAIRKLFPSLKSHKVLGKWLYISQKNEDYESALEALCRLALKNDSRIGNF